MKPLPRRAKGVIDTALLFAGVVGIVGPPNTIGAVFSGVADIASFLVTPDRYWLFAQERPFLLLLTIGLAYNAFITFRFRNIPISVLKTKIKITHLEADGSRVRVEREQHIRANHPGVTAYYMEFVPRRGAWIRKDEIDCWCEGCEGVDSTKHLMGDERSGIECIQTFKPALPYSWYLPLLPMALLIRGVPKKYAIRRRVRTVYQNDFSQQEPSFEIASTQYPFHNVSIEVKFHQDNIPQLRQINAQLIKSIAMHSVQVNPVHGDDGAFLVEIDKLNREKLRLAW